MFIVRLRTNSEGESIDYNLFLALLGLSMTFLLWGMDKILEVAEPALHSYKGRHQFIPKILLSAIPMMKFVAGSIFVVFGLSVIYLLYEAGSL